MSERTTEPARLMIKVVNVSKRYRYGQIGTTTLREELQRKHAKLHHREDPTSKIDAAQRAAQHGGHAPGETFLALDGVSFDVRRGERLGIIGHNGAGKSTLLKLISQITAPTAGDIYLDGKVASMLEVGTGFNDELTGRENIYMKGAIMGMKRREIDAVLDDIIEFSECREFIETPVKRYSSGMRVKLAFAVAAHLDAEIMIMDEVLAVGDVAFQQKCLKKMEEVSNTLGRTILYVSHNMNTIRQLCDRCLVLERGQLIFDGDVEEAIALYLGMTMNTENFVDLSVLERDPGSASPTSTVRMTAMQCLGTQTNVFDLGSQLNLMLSCMSTTPKENVHLRVIIKDTESQPISMATTDEGFALAPGEDTAFTFTLNTSQLAPGSYTVNPVLYEVDRLGNDVKLDVLDHIYRFDIVQPPGFNNDMAWRQRSWGYYYNSPLELHRESAAGAVDMADAPSADLTGAER